MLRSRDQDILPGPVNLFVGFAPGAILCGGCSFCPSPLPRREYSMSAERKHREEIVRYGRMLHERGFVAAMDGNLSVRLDSGRILVTPTCVSKGAMRPGDMVVVDQEGTRVAGKRNVTSEIGMHLLIYRTRPDVQAIVHAHPPTATGFAAAGMALTEPLVCEVVMGLGCIPLARYGTPGTSELAQTLEPYVPHYDAILMSNHGVVAYGDTIEHAYMKMETVEHFAQIALVTHLLGRQQPLTGVDIEKLLLARTKYFGGKMNAAMPMSMARPPEKAS
jgi:L-fuculose-phosphate aldolase